jgi:hypothetical protein
MRRLAVIAAQIFLTVGIGVVGQTPATAPGEPYRFIDTGNFSRLREGLAEAGTRVTGFCLSPAVRRSATPA